MDTKPSRENQAHNRVRSDIEYQAEDCDLLSGENMAKQHPVNNKLKTESGKQKCTILPECHSRALVQGFPACRRADLTIPG